MVSGGWSALYVSASRHRALVEAELFGGNEVMMRVAEVAGILVLIATAKGKWQFVVHHCREPCNAFSETHFAQAVGALQPALPLSLTSATAKPLDNHGLEGCRLSNRPHQAHEPFLQIGAPLRRPPAVDGRQL